MTLLMVLLTLVVVAGVISVATGVIRGGLDEPAPTIPVRTLPSEGVTGRDVATLRFVQGFRGYRMDQVDAALDTLALEVDRLRAQVAQERSARLHLARGGAVTTTGEGIVTIDPPLPAGFGDQSGPPTPAMPDEAGGTGPGPVTGPVTGLVAGPIEAGPPTGPITRPLRRPRRRAEGSPPATGEMPSTPEGTS